MHTRSRSHPDASVAGFLHRVHATESRPGQRPTLAIILGNRVADATPELPGSGLKETGCRAERRSTCKGERLRLCVEFQHPSLRPQPQAPVLRLMQEEKLLSRFPVFIQSVKQFIGGAVKRLKPEPIRRGLIAGDDTKRSISQLPDDLVDATTR